GIEVDGSLPISSKLGLAYGAALTRLAFPDGTDNLNHSQSLVLRWRPANGVEIIPFWSLYNDYNDEAGVFYSQSGAFLPPLANPPTKNTSVSGEVRLTHSMVDGPRLHVIHLSVRERDAHRQFGGSAVLDYGPGRIGQILDVPKPSSFDFGEVSRQHLTQTTYGVAYDGRWRNVGEISFSVSKAHYRKTTAIPGDGSAVARSSPWLYNGTAAANLTKTVTIYAGYARGLEESGLAPPNAANRNSPLPTIITTQKD